MLPRRYAPTRYLGTIALGCLIALEACRGENRPAPAELPAPPAPAPVTEPVKLTWLDAKGPNALTARALDVLDSAAIHGLDPDDYDAALLRAQAGNPAALIPAEFDARLNAALLTLGHDVAVGRLSPSAFDPRWTNGRTAPDVAGTLSRAASPRAISRWLDEIRPRHAQYAALQAVLAANDVDDDTANLIGINMERWRWLPDDLGARHLWINIPEFTLAAKDNGHTSLTMRVVVGKARTNETPVLTNQLSTLVFSPSWTVPISIARSEIRPAIARDPNYLERLGMEPAGATFRQRPGPSNALGRVKFLLANGFDIYLHDTPSVAHFTRASRALSHGCVRLEKPATLADYLLGGQQGWTTAAIRRAMNSGDERFVKLPAPLPVHIVYFTVWVDADGRLKSAADIYGHDTRHPKSAVIDAGIVGI
jgi:murein L,D-transpeptidase YcbB/YkuD